MENKRILLFLSVLFIFIPVHAASRANLVQLNDDLEVLEKQQQIDREKQKREKEQKRLAQEKREREVKARQQEKLRLQQERIREVVARQRLEEQQQIDREKQEKEKEQKRLVQGKREREVEARRQEKLRLQQERIREVVASQRLEEQQQIDREKQKREKEQKRLAQEKREREVKARRQEKLSLQQKGIKLTDERKRIEEQQRIDREKQEKEKEALVQEQKEPEIEELRLQREREQQQLIEHRKERLINLQQEIQRNSKNVIQRLNEQSQIPFLRITTVPYDSKGTWVKDFIKQLNISGGLTHQSIEGYIFFSSSKLMRGLRSLLTLSGIEYILRSFTNTRNYYYYKLPKGEKKRKIKASGKKIKEELAGLYKIHLMPKNAEDFMKILEQFFKALEANPLLQEIIASFKVKDNLDFQESSQALKDALIAKYEIDKVPPIIVIYPTIGKENAQFALDSIYALFKNVEGLDLTPRFNEKITNLIYYAQGNANEKMDTLGEKYFTEDKIVYIPDFVSKKNPQDYHLRSPTKTSIEG